MLIIPVFHKSLTRKTKASNSACWFMDTNSHSTREAVPEDSCSLPENWCLWAVMQRGWQPTSITGLRWVAEKGFWAGSIDNSSQSLSSPLPSVPNPYGDRSEMAPFAGSDNRPKPTRLRSESVISFIPKS